MIAAIILVSLAFTWLGYETDWLAIRLLAGAWGYTDIEMDYDGSDHIYLDNYQLQLQDAIQNMKYNDWLAQRYAVKTSWYPSQPPAYADNPQDKWMSDMEKLTARRNGEMIYQRIKG